MTSLPAFRNASAKLRPMPVAIDESNGCRVADGSLTSIDGERPKVARGRRQQFVMPRIVQVGAPGQGDVDIDFL